MSEPSIENVVYQAIIKHLEELEHLRVYQGNGHHLAQRLTTMVTTALTTRRVTVDSRILARLKTYLENVEDNKTVSSLQDLLTECEALV